MFKFELGQQVQNKSSHLTIKGEVVERAYNETKFDKYVVYVVQVGGYGVYRVAEDALEEVV
jgi:hypothetical protein